MSVLVSIGLAVVAIGPFAAPAIAGGPTNESYPGTCLKNATNDLQDCIDAAFPGSTITLTSEILNEDADITKDLTLKALDRSLQPLLDHLFIRTTGPDALQVTVEDIRFENLVQVYLSQGTGHDVRLRRLEVGRGSDGARGVDITTQVPASVTVEGSYIRSDEGNQDDALNMFAEDPDGSVVFRVIGNRINLHGNSNSGSGIIVTMQDDGFVRAELMNNSIWDVGRCNCGAASGIAVVPYRLIRADVNIVGNTIERSFTTAIQQRNSLTGSGYLRLDVFNNILSHARNPAIYLESGTPGSLTFRAGHNDYYASAANRLDGESAGSGNRSVDPKFVDRAAGKLQLRSSSPLIDKGQVCSPGGVAIRDASGNTRLYGSSVDMGAYERGAGAVTGKALVGTSGANTLNGTSGADILCGYGGKDTLKGTAGNDWLDGGSDKDSLNSGSGSDRSYGGSGNDTICANDGVHGNDRSYGGSGSDKGRTDSGDTRVSIESSASC